MEVNYLKGLNNLSMDVKNETSSQYQQMINLIQKQISNI